jgi:hypothetical protein
LTNLNRYILISQTRWLDNSQSSAMVHKFHMPTQQNILEWLLVPSYSGKSILRKNMMSSTSSSGKMYWLLGHNSELSIHNKIILFKQVICPVWSYGIHPWGCISDSNIEVIQCYQNKVLKCIFNAPWYVKNSDLHLLSERAWK